MSIFRHTHIHKLNERQTHDEVRLCACLLTHTRTKISMHELCKAQPERQNKRATERAQQKRATDGEGGGWGVCLQGFVVMRRLNDRCRWQQKPQMQNALTHTQTLTSTRRSVFVFGFGDETPYRRCDVKGVCCNHQRCVNVVIVVVAFDFAVCSARQNQLLKRRYQQRNYKLNTLFVWKSE